MTNIGGAATDAPSRAARRGGKTTAPTAGALADVAMDPLGNPMGKAIFGEKVETKRTNWPR